MSTILDTTTPFNFLGDLGYPPSLVQRMNYRHKHIIEPIRKELQGASVLDLGSHDGRWPFAIAEAGAASVLGIEGRGDLIAKFDAFPDPAIKQKVKLVKGDFVLEMDRLLAERRQFDVVACLGVYYHTMHHYRMLVQMTQFKPKAIVIDSDFSLAKFPLMTIVKEKTDKYMNTIAQAESQPWAPVGRISRPALDMMSESVGYSVDWISWNIPEGKRGPVGDYFGHPTIKDVCRFTAVLRPLRS